MQSLVDKRFAQCSHSLNHDDDIRPTINIDESYEGMPEVGLLHHISGFQNSR